MARKRLLRKVLRYRDQTGRGVAAHAAHWEGFTWEAGPVIVASLGPWGTVQVWASSEAEGKRVIRHAGAAGGFDPDDPNVAEWVVSSAPPGRVGKTATMGVVVNADGIGVSKRQGPSGEAEYVQPA